ncbi:hypothetical protein CYMTET_21402 [Cymbomonas tetramitiformis]|uniref:Uncharacterized protein n=1 Tax=Cymbomonas tetramitiformis TaxID=36881 RepID=A0AAE0G1Z5_9CHLO|nr:hypothetical protein CYMTET_21402 [Cymbomonas tetramitiformis]
MTSKKIVCQTSAAPELVPVGEFSPPLSLFLQVDGQTWQHSSASSEPELSLLTSFTYSWHHTPMVYAVEPAYPAPGSLLQVQGRICEHLADQGYILVGNTLCDIAADPDSAVELPGDGEQLLTDTPVGNVSLAAEKHAVRMPSGLWMDSTTASMFTEEPVGYSCNAQIGECCVGWFYCRLPEDIAPGAYNISISGTLHYGNSVHQEDSTRALRSGAVGHLEVLAGVTEASVNPYTSTVTVSGADVDSTVYVGSNPCPDARRLGDGQVECAVSDVVPLFNRSGLWYPGGPGVTRRWWALDNVKDNFTRITDLGRFREFLDHYEANGGYTRESVQPVEVYEGALVEGDVKLASYPRGTPWYYLQGGWHPVCGHWLWDDHHTADAFCRKLGYSEGRVRATWRRLEGVGGVYFGRCLAGETLGQCSGGHSTWEGMTKSPPSLHVPGGRCYPGERAGVDFECAGLLGAPPQGLVASGEDTVATLTFDADVFMGLGTVNVAVQLSGMFVPTSSSQHRFLVWAGHEARVYLSAAGGAPDAASQRTLLVAANRSSAPREWTSSAWVALEKGARYYVEVLFTGVGEGYTDYGRNYLKTFPRSAKSFGEVGVEVRQPDAARYGARAGEQPAAGYRARSRANGTAAGLRAEKQVVQVYSEDLAGSATVNLSMSTPVSWPSGVSPAPSSPTILHYSMDPNGTSSVGGSLLQDVYDVSGNARHGRVVASPDAAQFGLTAALGNATVAPLALPGALQLTVQHSLDLPTSATDVLLAADGMTLALWYRRADAAVASLVHAAASSGASATLSFYDYPGDDTCAEGLARGSACCAASCGACGGAGCSLRPGGASACCADTVLASKRSCYTNQAPCTIGLQSAWWEDSPGLAGALSVSAGLSGCVAFEHHEGALADHSSSLGAVAGKGVLPADWDSNSTSNITVTPQTPQCWRAGEGYPGSWYQIDTGSPHLTVGGVVTRGCEGTWPAAFTAEWRPSASAAWEPVDGGRTFGGNTDASAAASHLFSLPVQAVSIRVRVTSAGGGGGGGVAAQFALLTCGNVAKGRPLYSAAQEDVGDYGVVVAPPPAGPSLVTDALGRGVSAFSEELCSCVFTELVVDLEQQRTVHTVRLFGSSASGARWTVRVGSAATQFDDVCEEGVEVNGEVSVACRASLTGRYVSVWITTAGSGADTCPNYVCELEAYLPPGDTWMSPADLIAADETATSSVAADGWTHVALVVSGHAATKYVNGRQVASSANGASLFRRLGALSRMEVGHASSLYGFAGDLADVRLYGAALSPPEVLSTITAAQRGLSRAYPLAGEFTLAKAPSGATATMQWGADAEGVQDALLAVLQGGRGCTYGAAVSANHDFLTHRFDDVAAHWRWDGNSGARVVHSDPLCGSGALEVDSSKAVQLYRGVYSLALFPYLSMGFKLEHGTKANMVLRVALPTRESFYCSVMLSYQEAALDGEWWAPPCGNWGAAELVLTNATWQWAEINLLEQMTQYFNVFSPPAPTDASVATFEIHEIWLRAPELATSSRSNLQMDYPHQQGPSMGGALHLDDFRVSHSPRSSLRRGAAASGSPLAEVSAELVVNEVALLAAEPFPWQWTVHVTPGGCVASDWLSGLSASSTVAPNATGASPSSGRRHMLQSSSPTVSPTTSPTASPTTSPPPPHRLTHHHATAHPSPRLTRHFTDRPPTIHDHHHQPPRPQLLPPPLPLPLPLPAPITAPD